MMRTLSILIASAVLGCERSGYVASKAQLRDAPTEECLEAGLASFGAVQQERRKDGDTTSITVWLGDGSRYFLSFATREMEVSWGTMNGRTLVDGLSRIKTREAQLIQTLSGRCGAGIAGALTCFYETPSDSAPRPCP
jgi:hypothetical protein